MGEHNQSLCAVGDAQGTGKSDRRETYLDGRRIAPAISMCAQHHQAQPVSSRGDDLARLMNGSASEPHILNNHQFSPVLTHINAAWRRLL